eukprot:3767667-Pleurochrysis_carterae.AAC.1
MFSSGSAAARTSRTPTKAHTWAARLRLKPTRGPAPAVHALQLLLSSPPSILHSYEGAFAPAAKD